MGCLGYLTAFFLKLAGNPLELGQI